jgi:hypothetical protein
MLASNCSPEKPMSNETIPNAAPKQLDPVAGISSSKIAASDPDDLSVSLPGLRAWLSALKVVSLLAAIGFVAKLAHEQMLGIQLTDWSALDLSLFAGKWIVDTLTTSLNVLAYDYYLDLIVILIALSPALLMIFMKQYLRLLRVSRILGVGLSAVGLSFVIVYFEMPTFALNNWLNSDLTILASKVYEKGLGSREEFVRYVYFMSKTNLNKDQIDPNRDAIKDAVKDAVQPEVAQNSTTNTDATKLDVLSREAAVLFPTLLLTQPIASSDALLEIKRWYSTSLWVCCIALITMVVFVVHDERHLTDKILSAFYYFTAFVLLPVACTLLPYMYGKLVCLSEFPEAKITAHTQQLDGHTKQAQDNTFDGILIGQGDKGYRLLSVLSEGTLIQTIPEARIIEGPTITGGLNKDIVKYVLFHKATTALRN